MTKTSFKHVSTLISVSVNASSALLILLYYLGVKSATDINWTTVYRYSEKIKTNG